jgi:hypothetical protein
MHNSDRIVVLIFDLRLQEAKDTIIARTDQIFFESSHNCITFEISKPKNSPLNENQRHPSALSLAPHRSVLGTGRMRGV